MSKADAYRVLARKYRPQTFDDLVGQEALVRTLSNAIATGRIAHAFLLTGIRGIGKTTTARIIARALNCTGADGKANATASPCGVCDSCIQIGQDRHVDVIEMDAASRTGVGDIRELIETVHYAPAYARYKVYIIDEVHMLSTNAFNALLKTLEEPPERVIFVFATTEIRKIPVTILSRCQRFDLKRLTPDALSAHLQTICTKEDTQAEPEALRLIADAAEGSVRDGLSLLDQAISHSYVEDDPNVHVQASTVRAMLGLADKTRLCTLLAHCLQGEAEPALELLNTQYNDGADMLMLFTDMLHLVHLASRAVVTPNAAFGAHYTAKEQEHILALTQGRSVALFSRVWQMILKGMEEIRMAPQPLPAAEMLVLRLCYGAHLPTPDDLVRSIRKQLESGEGVGTAASASSSNTHTSSHGLHLASAIQPTLSPQIAPEISHAPKAALSLAVDNTQPQTYEAVLHQLQALREPLLCHYLTRALSCVELTANALTLAVHEEVPADFSKKLQTALHSIYGTQWQIMLQPATSTSPPTLAKIAQSNKTARMHELQSSTLISQLLQQLEDAELKDIITISVAS